jgi:beta-lactam-binding protein with PASTA domain/predicted Ser/Thr protein kinase
MSEQGPTVFKDRYEVHRKLARGGMSDVYLARDRVLDRPVALKVLFPEYAKDDTFVARFRREAQSAARLNHPNIVGVYDWGEETGTYFIAMEYIDGQTLSEIVRAEGPLRPEQAASVIADVAAALGFAHTNGVIHRDIKPGNVMVESTGLVKVADFGIAQAIGGPEQTQLTRVGSVMGTATYFSPEQAQGRQVDPRTDIYSLGCVLFEILTGRPPFTGETPVAIAYKHVQEMPPAPSTFAQVPRELDAIVAKCLAKTPDGRYETAEQLRDDLRRFLEGQPVAALAGAAAAGAAGAAAGYMAGAGDATAAYGAPVTGTNPAYGADAAAATSALPVTGADHYPPGTGMQGAVSPYGQPPAKKKPNPWLIGALVLFLLFVAGALILVAMNLGSNTTPRVRVPDVEGQQIADVRAQFGDDFDIQEQPVPSHRPPGEITEQSLPANSEVEKGSTFTLKVSAGNGAIPVPSVENLTEADARTRLENAGFSVRVQQEASDTIAEGKVIRQEPAPGQQAQRGAVVTIYVSTGKGEVSVTDVEGLNVATAIANLQRDGFTNITQVNEPSSQRANTVIRTSPAAGTTVAKNTPIVLYVSTGQSPTTAATTTTTTSTSSTSTSTSRSTTSTTDRNERTTTTR